MSFERIAGPRPVALPVSGAALSTPTVKYTPVETKVDDQRQKINQTESNAGTNSTPCRCVDPYKHSQNSVVPPDFFSAIVLLIKAFREF